jgi:hypothetical protein
MEGWCGGVVLKAAHYTNTPLCGRVTEVNNGESFAKKHADASYSILAICKLVTVR